MKINVLDHGYVRFVEAWGHGDAGSPADRHNPDGPDFRDDYECGIIEAARQSTQGSFRGWEAGDAKLAAFMLRNGHATPFEFAGMVIEVRAPIFVFREWHRHRTQSYNEMSARYAPLPEFDYTPAWADLKRRGEEATGNRQADGTSPFDEDRALAWWHKLGSVQKSLQEFYQEGLAAGVPKELARIELPVGRYSQMRASANLRNWLGFVTLRSAPNAQQEIRHYSNAVWEILKVKFPRSLEYQEMRRA